MTSEEFIDLVKKYVSDDAVQLSIKGMRDPGKAPTDARRQLCAWYGELPNSDRVFVHQAIQRGVESALWGLFCLLDHVRTIEPRGEKGTFELSFTKGGLRTQLNDPYNPLH